MSHGSLVDCVPHLVIYTLPDAPDSCQLTLLGLRGQSNLGSNSGCPVYQMCNLVKLFTSLDLIFFIYKIRIIRVSPTLGFYKDYILTLLFKSTIKLRTQLQTYVLYVTV